VRVPYGVLMEFVVVVVVSTNQSADRKNTKRRKVSRSRREG